MRFLISVLILGANAFGLEKGPIDRLTDQSDAIVVGSVQSGRQNGTSVSFALLIDRTIKGNVSAGQVLTVFWRSPLALTRDLTGKNYGLWFLAKNSDGTLGLLPPLNGLSISLERAYLPLSPNSAPNSNAAAAASTTLTRITDEVLTAMQHYSDSGQLRDLGHALFGIVEPSGNRGNAFRILSANSDPELRFIGLAGRAKDGDVAALAELANGASVIPSLKTGEFSLGVIGSMRSGDPGAIEALTVVALSTNFDLQRRAAEALCDIHTRDTLASLAALLNSHDTGTREYAMKGLSLFVDNLPIITWDSIPSQKWRIPQGRAIYKTPTTDQYSLSTRSLDGTQEAAYLQFWKSWWLEMKDQLLSR